MMKPQAERLILCSTTHLPPAALSSGAQSPSSVLAYVSMGQVPRKGWKMTFCFASPQALAMPLNLHVRASLHVTLPMHKKQHRPILGMRFLLQLPTPAQAQAFPSRPPNLAASGIPQLNPPANNPRLPLSNHSRDVLATSVLITKQCQGPFPTAETNWDSVAVPFLQVSTP